MKKLAVLAALSVGLIVAFVLSPAALAATRSTADLTGNARIVEAFRSAFIVYWGSGDRAFDPETQRVVDYWFRYHVAKGVFAAALVVVLSVLGVLIWRAFLRASGLRAVILAAGGILATGLATLSLAAVMANIHGMAAPFGSLLPLLLGDSDGPLAATLASVRQQLAAGNNLPALDVITGDYVRFHAVMAAEGSIVAVALVALTVLLWRRFAVASGRARHVLGAYGVFAPLLTLALIVIVIANATTAAHPQPGLEGFFAGGW